ncbi:MAG: uroporphyrinogen decarboxylase family protein [bacterium]
MSKQRIMKALYLEEPDRVPLFDFIFNPDIFRKVLGHFPPLGARDWVECTRKMGLDGLWLPGDAPEGYTSKAGEEKGSFYDEWGQKCLATTEEHWPVPYIVGHPLENIDKLSEYEPPDPHAEGRIRTIEEAIKFAQDDMAILGGVGGPFSNSAFLTGFTTYSLLIYENPSAIHRIARMVTYFWTELGKRFIDTGVNGIFVSDDLGTDDSLFISPTHYREFVFPYLREMVSAFQKKGVAVLLHCDGNINAIVEDLVNTGIYALHPIQRKAHMNIVEIKEKFGNKICLIGNVDVTKVLPFGTREEIISQTMECIQAAAPGGGYVLASDHSLTGISLERANIMFEVGRKYGRYPIDKR